MLAQVVRRTPALRVSLARSFGGHAAEPSAPWEIRSTKDKVGRALRETGVSLKEEAGEEIFSVRRPIMSLLGTKPRMANDAFVAPSATVIGEVRACLSIPSYRIAPLTQPNTYYPQVTLFDRASVWYSAVLRGDNNSIQIGGYSNVQDRCVINTVPTISTGFPSLVDVGNWTSIGAGSVLTSCTVGNKCDIGEGCVIGEGAVVSDNVVLLAGTIVPEGAYIPANTKWGGNPAAKIADLDDHDAEHAVEHAENVCYVAEDHIKEYLPVGNAYKHLEEVVEEAGSSLESSAK
jgi:carbonic anhydrase/acetyltransferase-like protein (isoleucine patch superfamily)